MRRRPSKTNDPQRHDEDVRRYGGYVYTVSKKFSSLHANARLTAAIVSAFDYRGKRVIDIGCGDGAYTAELFARTRPAELIGVDPAQEAVRVAQTKYGQTGLSFSPESIYALPFADGAFDVAVLRGVLHHLDRPYDGVKEVARVARTLVIADPNGYNLGLKFIERISPYHRQHREVSFSPREHVRWLMDAGARIRSRSYMLIVPFFSPDWLAKSLAALEPFIERTPLLRTLACSFHVIVAEMPQDR